jgi:hypothetical protein
MRNALFLALLALPWLPVGVRAQTPDELTRMIESVLDLETVDLTRQSVRFRSGLEPSLLPFEADESQMTVLKDPRATQGQGQARAAGWYRLAFVVPEKLGKIAVPKQQGYALGIESNVRGSWEIYTYVNGKRAGGNGTGGSGAPRFVQASNEPPHVWRSNAQLFTKPGDQVTVVILAMSSPFAESTEGFGLRHLRLRFAGPHSNTHQAFFGASGFSTPGTHATTGLLGARDKLAKVQGNDLQALRDNLRGPLARLDALFQAAETEDLDTFAKAMVAARDDINAALKK